MNKKTKNTVKNEVTRHEEIETIAKADQEILLAMQDKAKAREKAERADAAAGRRMVIDRLRDLATPFWNLVLKVRDIYTEERKGEIVLKPHTWQEFDEVCPVDENGKPVDGTPFAIRTTRSLFRSLLYNKEEDETGKKVRLNNKQMEERFALAAFLLLQKDKGLFLDYKWKKGEINGFISEDEAKKRDEEFARDADEQLVF